MRPDSMAPSAMSTEIGVLASTAIKGGEWAKAAAVIGASLLIAFAVNRGARRIAQGSSGPGFGAIVIARLVAYVVVLLGLIYGLGSLGVKVGPLLGALGLGGLVVALALQKVVEDFIAGVILNARRPFTVGDTVELGDHVGVVTDIDARTTVLRGLDGSSIRVPNGVVVSGTIVNLTKEPARRSTLEVGVAYDTDLDAATASLHAAIARVRRVLPEPPASVALTGFADSTIQFTIYYWHNSDVPSEIAARHDLILAVHQGLLAADVVIAFPQLVVWPGTQADRSPYAHPPGPVDSRRSDDADDHSTSGGVAASSWRHRVRGRRH
jgi:small conductance mechanosensitive channel